MQARYFTAQCCACHGWHASEDAPTHEIQTCRRRPWTKWGEPRSVLVARPLADQLADIAATLDLKSLVTVRADGRAKLRSPHLDVSHRAFLSTIRDAIADGIDCEVAVQLAVNIDGWNDLSEQYPVEIVTCPHCGESVRAEGLTKHQSQSNRCHWIRADTHVTELRAAGYRDPWSARPLLPLNWTALRSSQWRNCTVAVPFPHFNAVLVAGA